MAKSTETENGSGGALTSFVRGGNLPDIDRASMKANLQKSVDEGTSGNGGNVEFLSFSGKMGKWSLGRDKIEPLSSSIYLVEPMASVKGFTCWVDNRPKDKVEMSALVPNEEPDLKDYGPYGDGEGWFQMLGMGLIDVDKPGKMLRFTTTSKSGRFEVGSLIEELAEGLSTEDASQDMLPFIKLSMTEFTAQGKKNFKPLFPVLGWASRADIEGAIVDGRIDVDSVIQ